MKLAIIALGIVLCWLLYDKVTAKNSIKRGTKVRNKSRGNLGVILEVAITGRNILVEFTNPKTKATYSSWFKVSEFTTISGKEFK